jgi:hypothetical protein
MKRFIVFVALGSLAALLCEFAFKFFVTKDYAGFIFVLIFYPLYVSVLYAVEKQLMKVIKSPAKLLILVYILFGIIGLSIEWFVVGNSPWRNPQASQIGMWSFWTAIAVLPTINLTNPQLARRIALSLVVIYFGISVVLWLLLPAALWALIIIWEVVFYTALQPVYAYHVLRLARASNVAVP